MKTVAIYYFSGTGNTAIVAGMIEAEFLHRGVAVTLMRIEDFLKNGREMGSAPNRYDLIGIGHPVNGFGAPQIIADFIKALPDGAGKKVFLFKTAGGVAPVNYNASRQTIRRLSKKGYRVFYDRLFSLGSNWIVKFKDSVMRDLYRATKQKAAIMVEEIMKGKTRFLKTGFPLSVITGSIAFLHDNTVRFFGKDYRVSASCNHCGKCVRNCPTANIYEKNGRIKFKLSCLWCMRCLYGCPQNAIRHRLLSFCVVPGGYDIKKTLENPNLSTDCPGSTPPFLQNYLQNKDL